MRLGLIGYGALGAEVGASLAALGEADRLAGVLVRPGRAADSFHAVSDVAGLLATRPDVVLEAAGQGAVAEYGAAVLAAGVDLIITSTGALADPALVARLRDAQAGVGRLLIAPGAVAGLDGLIAARLAGLASVTYTSLKPPHAWRGTKAEESVDLDDPAEELVIFEGSAREAALAFPKNANVAVSVGLCGLGLDCTRARLVSSRRVSDPLGVIVADGAFGTFRFEIFARAAPDNPKSSRLTAQSLLQCARLRLGIPALALLDDGPDIRMETHAVA